jgi:thiosulfate reductase cytochrome b subunit
MWLIFHIFTENVNVYLLEPNPKKYLNSAWKQIQYYTYGIFKKKKNPYNPRPLNKFNPLQKVMYAVVMMIVVPAQFLTGIMLWDLPGWKHWVRAIGGLGDLRTIHYGLFIFFCLFLLMHIFLGTLGKKPTSHFKEMITGYEE